MCICQGFCFAQFLGPMELPNEYIQFNIVKSMKIPRDSEQVTPTLVLLQKNILLNHLKTHSMGGSRRLIINKPKKKGKNEKRSQAKKRIKH